jgi:tetratricopeptide (TPR) repeat protein
VHTPLAKRLLLAAAVAVTGLPLPVGAQDISEQIIPKRWLNQVLPEELPELEFRAYHTELDKAKLQVFHGRYRRALLTLSKIADADPIEAALIRGQAYAATGRVERALEALTADGVKDDPRVQILRARVLADTGRTREAIDLVRAHLQQHPESIPGRYWLGAFLESRGDLDGARAAFGWFVEPPQRFLEKWTASAERVFENAEEVVLIGRALDRWASLNGAYKDNRRLHDVILGMFVRAYDVIDREYWPAHVAAGEYLLTHNDSRGAAEELNAAVAANPRDLNTLALIGQIAVEKHDYDRAALVVEEMRKVDANSPAAALVEARLMLWQKKAAEAEKLIRPVLEAQPENLEALGLLATAQALSVQEKQMLETLERIDAIDPDNATAYMTIGMALMANHGTEWAVRNFSVAVERAPWWAAARTQHGIALITHGDEDAARAALEAAYMLDPFNVETVNYLRVLDQLAGFMRHETEHFVFVYDAQDDPIVPLYIAPYMEQAYREVCDTFQFEPPWKMVVEVFPDTDSFSVRTAGIPGLESFGASLGRVMTVVAPRRGDTLGAYNFARVLKHEFTHSINLTQTDGRCPRWLTEGLAVWQEDVEYRFTWVPPILHERAMEGKLFKIEQIQSAMIRPRRGEDGEIAYMEGFWVSRYMRETYGEDSILNLLNAFKEGKGHSDAFVAATGKPLETFEKEFFAWAKEQVKPWGYDKETEKKFEEFVKKGQDLIKAGEYEQALEVFQEAQKLQPLNPLPHQRLAGLYLSKKINEPLKAVPHLMRVQVLELSDNRYAKRVARLYRDLGEFDRAIEYGTHALYIDPYDASAHDMMAQLYDSAGQADKARQEREVSALLKERARRQD